MYIVEIVNVSEFLVHVHISTIISLQYCKPLLSVHDQPSHKHETKATTVQRCEMEWSRVEEIMVYTTQNNMHTKRGSRLETVEKMRNKR